MKKNLLIKQTNSIQKTLLKMKITILLLIVGVLNINANLSYSQSGTVSLNLNDVKVEDVLNELETNSGYYFLFNQNLVDVNSKVNVNVSNVPVQDVLNELFASANVDYIVYDKQIILAPREIIKSVSDFKQQKLTGLITDEETGELIYGATVAIDGTTLGTISDFDGKYSIDAPAEGATITFSFVGYSTVKVVYSGQKELNVKLKMDVTEVDEVVIVGYGTVKKSVVTGSVSKLGGDEIQGISVSRVDQAIQGRTAGITVLPSSGSPGAGTKIRIRGVNSNGNSNPLYIVDGMKTSDISNVDPGDIESIEILKDAASCAIYGTEGANGVILLSTRSGKAGVSKISYDFQYGIQKARTKMELMDAKQYKEWMTEAGLNPTDRFNSDTDWLSEVFESAPLQKHYLSLSGGNGKTSYMISGAYADQDGIVGGSKANYKRYTARVNVKSEVKDWLEVGTNLSYSHSKRHYVGEDDEYRGIVNNALLSDPLTPVLYDGTPDHVQDLLDGGKVILADGSGKYYGLSENVGGEIANPIALLQTYHNSIEADKILGSAYATLKPLKGLNITSRVGLDLSYQDQNWWSGEYYFSSENSNSATTMDNQLNKWHTWLWENFASYNFSLDKHNFTLLAGVSAQKYVNPYYTLHAGPLALEGDDYAHQGYALTHEADIVGGTYTTNTTSSLFSRISYNYAEKYLMEVSIRRDGSSVFPEDNKTALFPAISAGWVVSQEDFFENNIVTYAKVRASWGVNGSKANLPGNEDKELWQVSGLTYPNADGTLVAGAVIPKLINKELVWEKTESSDFGLDLRFLDDKLSFSFDYYNKMTKDLIVTGTGPLSVGANYPSVNGGNVSNKGFDFELGYRGTKGDLTYSVNLNLSTTKNEVDKLKVNAPVRGDNLRGYDLTWFAEGQPIWYFKGYKTDGILKDDEAAAAYNSKYGTEFKAGDPSVVDVNDDKAISASDQTYIGDPHPDFTYGATVNLLYKGFDFTLFLQGAKGNDVFMGWYRSDRPYANKPSYFHEDRWTETNKNASFSRANNESDYVYRSDLMVDNGSYMRIKQIQFGYTLPKDIVNKMKISSLRMFFSIDDYFTFTKYKGLDPEAGSATDNQQGVDRGCYPIAGRLMFGLSLGL